MPIFAIPVRQSIDSAYIPILKTYPFPKTAFSTSRLTFSPFLCYIYYMPETSIDTIDTDTNEIPARIDLTPTLTVPLVAALLQKNYSQAAISRYCGVTRQAVNQFISWHRDELAVMLDYENIMPRMLKKKVYEIISSIDLRDIKKASLQQKVTSAAIAIEKHRLLEGESTENIDIHATTRNIEELQAKRKALQAQLAALKVEDGSDD